MTTTQLPGGREPSLALPAPLDIHPVWLSFSSPDLERLYLAESARGELGHWRRCHVAGASLYLLFVIIHASTIPSGARVFYSIGFGAILPLFVAGFLLTWTEWFRRHWHEVNALYVVTTGFGALGMAWVAGAGYSFFTLTGFLFCYLFGFAVLRLRFVHATVAGTVLTVAFFAMAPALLGGDPAALWLGVLYVLAFQALGMLIAHNAEWFARNAFHARLELEARRAEVTRINQSLERRVEERTRDLIEKNRLMEEQIQRAERAEEERDAMESMYLQSQKMEALGTLAGGVAHDFNNLLMVILGYGEIVQDALDDDDPLVKEVGVIIEAAKSSASLVRQLLAFSRRQVVAPRRVDPVESLRRLERMLTRMIGEDVILKTEAPADAERGDLGDLFIDPGQFEQILINLAVNARDAMPNGGTLTFRVSACLLTEADTGRVPELSPGCHVLLQVQDTGHGMDAETLAHIFEPFFTTKEAGKGTGLGLATVYGIVRQAQGTVRVESSPGRGTTFSILLPCATTDLPDFQVLQPHTPASLQGDETVLVVDDEATVCEVVRRALAPHGYTVLTAVNAGEAILLTERHQGPIHLLLTDIVMPLMHGFELAGRLLQLRPELLVLYMTGFTDHELLRSAPDDRPLVIVRKPFSPREVVEYVRTALDSPLETTAPVLH